MLASLLPTFHGTGWLHINLHPNNIVSFATSSKGRDVDLSKYNAPQEPYVAEANMDRAAGQIWHQRDRPWKQRLNISTPINVNNKRTSHKRQ